MHAQFISSEIYRATGYRGNHPLAIQRVGAVLDLADHLGWLPGGYVQSHRASREELLAFHAPDYIDAIVAAEATRRVSDEARARFRIGTLENPVFPGLYERAGTSVGGSVQAARIAARGGVAYHPSGGTHHGMPAHASGFCFFNDPVFAILTLLDEGMSRVLYVDLDAHHGDGVEAAFADEARVMTVSIHEENRWPFTGRLGDRAGGNARNLPVPGRMNDSEFGLLMARAVLPLAQGFAPEAVVITCGADPLAGDPLSSLELSNVALWDAVVALARIAPSTVVLGGGGYNPWTVARCWTGLWGRLAGYEIPAALPGESRRLLESFDCDLVDEEDRLPRWTTTLADPRNDGPVRERFHEIAEAVLAPERNAEHVA
ncbi:acetoin utilization protein AcuC [Solirhodobacter olei]|uniref:acetoin utilization protein AcuC n=1 Tax=Solirhodobacter olei TaxID=2493082 RepID=UPI000FDA01FD|nr:acetoin utilization protein AcuC [Solirhodobacter olei]